MPALLPGVAVLALFLLWEAADGGFAPTAWYPGALFLLALLAVVTVAQRRALAGVPSPLVAAIGFLAAFTAWSYLSVAWSDVTGDAWDGANRTALYLTAFALFAVLPWRAGGAALLLGGFSAGTAAIGVVFVARTANAVDPLSSFIDARFSEPVGYANASCALFLTAFWPAVFLASHRALPPVLRGVMLAAAGVLLELALLPQSRALLIAFPAVLAVHVALVPGRARSLLAFAPVAVVTVAAAPRLLDVYEHAGRVATVRPALDGALAALAVSAAALLVVGIAVAAVDRRVAPSDAVARRARLAVAGAAVVAVAAAAAVGLAAIGNPVRWTGERWDEFTTVRTPDFEGRRLSFSLGTERYDFWRVALAEWREVPLHGLGADQFAVYYARERRGPDEPLYPHSVEIRVLTQTGLVGTVLFVGFLGCALAAAWRRRANGLAAGTAAVAVVAFAYWLVHGSIDWFWEFPGLTAPAFAFLALAGRVERDGASGASRGRARPASALALAPVAVALAVSYAAPWLAARNVELAAEEWRADRAAAFDRLERARRLNPLSDRPDLIAGAIASRTGDRRRMRAAFTRAVERNPHGWYAHLELALVDALDGRRADALRRLARARELNPLEPAIATVDRAVRAGRPVSPRAVDRIFLERVRERSS